MAAVIISAITAGRISHGIGVGAITPGGIIVTGGITRGAITAITGAGGIIIAVTGAGGPDMTAAGVIAGRRSATAMSMVAGGTITTGGERHAKDPASRLRSRIFLARNFRATFPAPS
jgi:hypothetical protein